jgi:hypothetical protein
MDGQAERQTERQTNRYTDGWTDGWMDGQAGRQTDRQVGELGQGVTTIFYKTNCYLQTISSSRCSHTYALLSAAVISLNFQLLYCSQHKIHKCKRLVTDEAPKIFPKINIHEYPVKSATERHS